MESVEEICSHVALINQSKTILEGTIENVKKQYNNDNYQITIKNGSLENTELYEVINKEKNVFNILLKEDIWKKKALNYINSNYEILSSRNKVQQWKKFLLKLLEMDKIWLIIQREYLVRVRKNPLLS